MKITVLDGYTENPGDLSWDALASLGELRVFDRLSHSDDEAVADAIDASEIIVTNKVPITRRVIDLCGELRFVSVIATGYNVVDVAYARERGIAVSNVPSYCTRAVAQFTFALLLELCHRVGDHSASVFSGKWQNSIEWCYWDFPQVELEGKTIGLVGFGRIGKAVASLARAFGMTAITAGSRPTDEGRALAEYVSLDELLSRADVVSLHCPLFESTREMINKDTIARMKDGAMLINTGRGPLVCERDVADALNSGKLAGFAADVVSHEPILADSPLLSAKNCVLTPHIAWSSRESRQRLMDTTVENVRAFIDGSPINTVNGP